MSNARDAYSPESFEFHTFLAPGLGPAVRRAYHLPDMAQVRNPRHVKALAAACAKAGVRMGGPSTAVRITSKPTFPECSPQAMCGTAQ